MKKSTVAVLMIIGSVAALAGCGKKEELTADQVWSNIEEANAVDSVLTGYGSVERSTAYKEDGQVVTQNNEYYSSDVYCMESAGNYHTYLYMDAESGFQTADDENFVYIIDDEDSYSTFFENMKKTELGDGTDISLDEKEENTIVRDCESSTRYYVYDPDTYLIKEYYSVSKDDGSENCRETFTYNEENKDEEYKTAADQVWAENVTGTMANITIRHEDGSESSYEVPEGWEINVITLSDNCLVYEDGTDYFYDPVKDGDVFTVKKYDENANTEAEAGEGEESLVTMEDVYNANYITDVLSRHKSITAEYQSKQGTDDILGTATYQITFPDDGNTMYVATMDNGEDVYDIQSYQNDNYIYTYNETTKEGAVGFLYPDDYITFIQQQAYLPSYDTYTYSNTANSMEDGALIVSADIDDVGQVYMWVDPDTYEIYGINYIFDSGVITSTTLTYDNPADMNISVLDDAKENGTSVLTVSYINDSYSEDIDYEIPTGSDAAYVGMMTFDLYTDENCSDDSYIREIEDISEPVTVYAKYVAE